MEYLLVIEVVLEEVNLSGYNISNAKLQISVESCIKQYIYPYKDIYFQIYKTLSYPIVKLELFIDNIIIEGSHTIRNFKVSEKIRIQLSNNEEIIGHMVLKIFFLENFKQEICKHCELINEIIAFSSKSVIKLEKVENKPIDHDIGLEINLEYIKNKEKFEKEDAKYIKNLLLGAHEKVKTYEIINSIKSSVQNTPKNSIDNGRIDYQKIISTLEYNISIQNKTIDQLHLENKNANDL